MLTELLTHIVDILETNLTLSDDIIINTLEVDGGISLQLSSGSNENYFKCKSMYITIPLLFLCKNADQQTCINDLDAITSYLNDLTEYPQPSSGEWQLANIVISTYPNYVDKEDNGKFIYSTVVDCKIFEEV